MTAVLDFYRGIGTDLQGRSIEDFFALDFEGLEKDHLYIQWIFPLPDPSVYNPEAPLLTAEDALAFRTEKALRTVVAAAVLRMVSFYEGTRHWLTPNNHNHLRITRILKFLSLCGFGTLADYVWSRVSIFTTTTPGCLTQRTVLFWQEALNTPALK